MTPEESERWLSSKPPRAAGPFHRASAIGLDNDQRRAAGFPPYDNGLRMDAPNWTPMRVIPELDGPPEGATWRAGDVWLDDDGNEVSR